MPRPAALAEQAVEAQVRIRDLRRGMAPVFAAAMASRSFAAVAEAKAVAESLRVAERQARRLAGIADGIGVCADGLFEPGHGRAA